MAYGVLNLNWGFSISPGKLTYSVRGQAKSIHCKETWRASVHLFFKFKKIGTVVRSNCRGWFRRLAANVNASVLKTALAVWEIKLIVEIPQASNDARSLRIYT